MTRSIFDPEGGQTEHSGSTFTGSAASERSHMPEDLVDGKTEPGSVPGAPADASEQDADTTESARTALRGSLVVGLFNDRTTAEEAVRDLVTQGFSRDEMNILATGGADDTFDVLKRDDEGSSTGIGAGLGAVAGGGAGILAGLGMLIIPGIGPILATGPIVAGLIGASAGALAGGVVGSLVDQGIPDEHAHTLAEGLRRGGSVLTVSTDPSRVNTAAEILRTHGAVDVSERAEQWRRDGWKGFDPHAKPYERERDASRDRPEQGGATYPVGVLIVQGIGLVRYQGEDTHPGPNERHVWKEDPK